MSPIYNLDTSIYDFSVDHSIFGVCAGSILMSKKSFDALDSKQQKALMKAGNDQRILS